MPGLPLNFDDDDVDSYPYLDENRLRRTPYEERMLDEIARANDPYSSPRIGPVEDRFNRSGRRDDLPPVLTLREPSDERHRREHEQGETRLDPILRGSESPPPRPRGSRRRVDRFEDTFGDLERPARGSGQRYDYGASGPPRDPFRREEQSADHRPYGGGRAPNDPFRPGGHHYDYEREFDERHPSLEPPNRPDMDERARRRDDHYRSRVGEPWGLAEMNAYERRRRNEERMRSEYEHDLQRAAERPRGSAMEDWVDEQGDFDRYDD